MWYDTDTNIIGAYNGTTTVDLFNITSGAAMDGVVIGGTTPAASTFTTCTITTADINGGNIDGTIIGATTPANATLTQIDIENTTPTIYFDETDGTSTFQKVVVTLASSAFVIGTRTDVDGFVSNDYVMDRDASGATNHSFKVAGSEVLGVTSSGIDVSGMVTFGDANTGIRRSGSFDVGLYCAGSLLVQAASSTGLIPGADNTYILGAPSFRWSTVYAVTDTISTSDVNLKTDIEELNDAETRVAQAVKGLIRRYRWKDAVEEKGDKARYHFGVMAQEVVAAFDAEGLDAHEYGMICLDDTDDGERYGVRYDELLAFIIAAI
jgi:hypothetical protein